MGDIGAIGWVVLSLHVIICAVMITIVLMQSGKESGLSGSIAGGAETFFGKNKGKTVDGVLSRLTSVFAIAFLFTSMMLYWIINHAAQ